jgi:hypothetical protein
MGELALYKMQIGKWLLFSVLEKGFAGHIVPH